MRVCPTCFSLYGPDTATCPADGQTTEDYVQVLVGRTLGPYRVLSVVGEGGMGVVYECEHPTIGRRVALKVLRPELSLRDDLVERFIQEARAVNTIGHGNIVNIYDFGKTPFGSFYIVMEYLDGDNVRTLVEREGPQPLERVRLTVRGVGAALAAAHAKGFIHRDVKPENIMIIRRRGREYVKLLDFGIVKLLTDDQPRMVRTQADARLGTPKYMSPEQLEQSDVDHRADIYALGAVSYEMLTGKVPFEGDSEVEIRQLQMAHAPLSPSLVLPGAGFSRKVDSAVLWALSVDPANRCSTIVDFITAFEDGYQDSVGTREFPGTPSQPGGQKLKLALAVSLGLLAIVIGVVIALVLLRPQHQPGAGPAPAARPDAAPGPAPLNEAQKMELARTRLRAALGSGEASQRALAAELIGQARRPLMTEKLVAALDDPDPQVRRAAARALGRMQDRQAVPALKRALEDRVGYGAIDVATALAQLGDRAGVTRLRRELARSKNPFRRKYVLHALGELRDRAALEWRRVLAGSRLVNQRLRFKALGYLAALRDSKALATLNEAAQQQDWRVRVLAAEALAAADREAAIQVLKEVLAGAAGEQRTQAAILLAQFGDTTATDVLLESSQASDPESRRRSVLALGFLPRKGKVKARLMQALEDPEFKVSLAAAVALLRPH
jgi:HEAT repeat protein